MQLGTQLVWEKVPLWLHLGYHWCNYGETSHLHVQRMLYKQCKSGYDKSKSKGTFLGEESTFMLYFRFHMRDFPENPHITLTLPALKT
jgi:hypothetical protein